MLTQPGLIDSLRDVIDPEMNMNIVDLGLVYRAEVHPERVIIEFTLTSPGCPLVDHIRNEIITQVGKVTSRRIEANIVWEPPWDESKMTEEAKVAFGYPI